jgi:hypothetical protein
LISLREPQILTLGFRPAPVERCRDGLLSGVSALGHKPLYRAILFLENNNRYNLLFYCFFGKQPHAKDKIFIFSNRELNKVTVPPDTGNAPDIMPVIDQISTFRTAPQ